MSAGRVVRKMYQKKDLTKTNLELERIKEDRLHNNPDVLFKLYSPRDQQRMNHLHSLIFRPTADINHWMRFIKEAYGNLTAQFSRRETQPIRFEIELQGTWQELREFLRDFPNNLQEINNIDDDDDDEGTEAVVRDIYGVGDATGWGDSQRKTFRDDQLDRNADVLFRVYSPVHPPDIQKLHCLLLRPTRDPIWWMMFIRKHYEVLTVQRTHRVSHRVTVRDVINISGNRDQLLIFCREFPNHLREINNNHDENISVDDHIEDLTDRIQELQLQNRRP